MSVFTKTERGYLFGLLERETRDGDHFGLDEIGATDEAEVRRSIRAKLVQDVGQQDATVAVFDRSDWHRPYPEPFAAAPDTNPTSNPREFIDAPAVDAFAFQPNTDEIAAQDVA